MKHKRDDGPEKQEDEGVDVTPVMICVFVVMCCFMLVLLYYFYDRLGMPPTRPPTHGAPSTPRGPTQEPRGHCCLLDFLPFLPLAVPAPLARPRSLCDHWDLLPGLFHRSLQLSGTLCAQAALLHVQVSPGLTRPLPSPPPPVVSYPPGAFREPGGAD